MKVNKFIRGVCATLLCGVVFGAATAYAGQIFTVVECLNNGEPFKMGISQKEMAARGVPISIVGEFEHKSDDAYRSGTIGGIGKGASDMDSIQIKIPDEPEITMEEALEVGVLGNPGSGSVIGVGPDPILANRPNQEFFVRVNNLSREDSSFGLAVAGGSLNPAFQISVNVEGSKTEVNYVNVPIPLVANPLAGNYEITCTLSSTEVGDTVTVIPVKVYNPTDEELVEMRKKIDSGEFDELDLPEEVLEQYKKVINSSNENEKGRVSL